MREFWIVALIAISMIIFRMDGDSVNYTRSLEKFSVFAPDIWNRFEMTKNYRFLEELSTHVPENYQDEYRESFKEYMNRLHKDEDVFATTGEYHDDEVRETRKEA
jgi:hypothetical protein